MKILINNYPGDLMADKRQELPGDTLVEFLTDANVKYEVVADRHGRGLQIRVVRPQGGDQMLIYPRMGNMIAVE